MRHLLIIAALLCAAGSARAQVTVDLHALDALPGAPAKALPPRHAAPPRAPVAAAALPLPPGPAPASTATEKTAASIPAPAASVPAPQPPPPAATLPTSVPAVASLPPVQSPAPPANPVPAPVPPVAANAATTSAATQTGLRLTFAKGQSDLSPASVESIKQLVQGTPHSDDTTFNVVAYASGSPDDPSVARRLSLSRAVAVRAALVSDGVASARIYMRALGAQPGDGPADRVDLSVLGANAAQTRSQ